MDEDPVLVIQTLQAYKSKLEAQIETLRIDISTCKSFQAKYGTRCLSLIVGMLCVLHLAVMLFSTGSGSQVLNR